jgi:hypothetical protein
MLEEILIPYHVWRSTEITQDLKEKIEYSEKLFFLNNGEKDFFWCFAQSEMFIENRKKHYRYLLDTLLKSDPGIQNNTPFI